MVHFVTIIPYITTYICRGRERLPRLTIRCSACRVLHFCGALSNHTPHRGGRERLPPAPQCDALLPRAPHGQGQLTLQHCATAAEPAASQVGPGGGHGRCVLGQDTVVGSMSSPGCAWKHCHENMSWTPVCPLQLHRTTVWCGATAGDMTAHYPDHAHTMAHLPVCVQLPSKLKTSLSGSLSTHLNCLTQSLIILNYLPRPDPQPIKFILVRKSMRVQYT